ncbi:MAG TPA: hypothetical protein PKE45_10895 [Caldilineaceae bacterium]|nr:hypothetical protein [Caldilineaceae bacterium]
MTSLQLFRLGGLGLLAGAFTWTIHIVLRSIITAGADPATLYQEGLWTPINLLGVIGAILLLLGLPALYAYIAGPTGWLGLLGMVLIALAWMFFGFFLSLFSVLVAPWLAEQAPELIAGASLPSGFLIAFIVGLLAELVGAVLLAIPFVRGRVSPRWVGYLLPAAALLTVVGNLIAPSGPASNLAINLFSNLGPVLLAIAFAYLGFRMWVQPVQATNLELPDDYVHGAA